MSLNEEMISKELKAILSGYIERAIDRVAKYATTKSLFVKIHHKINSNATYDFDSDFVNSLSNEQLSNLIKFFTLFETNYYNRYSVTAIPTLLEILSGRNYEGYETLVNWAIKTANSKNPYIPFGALKYAACKSLSEYKSLVS